jgi:hypothetical protein
VSRYRLTLNLDDVIEVMNALADRDLRLAGSDPEFTATVAKVRAQLIAQRADVDLINDMIETGLPDVLT